MFILPINDSPNVKAVPWVTWSLVGLHLAVLFLVEWPAFDRRTSRYTFSMPSDGTTDVSLSALTAVERVATLWTEHAYWPVAPKVETLLSGVFLHPGALAAFVGLFLLILFGDNVEHHLGRWRYAALYVLGGAAGTLATSWFHAADSAPPIVGSGAALGTIIGAYLVFFPKSEIRVVYAVGRPVPEGALTPGGGAPYLPAWAGITLSLFLYTAASLLSSNLGADLSRASDSLPAGVALGAGAAFWLHVRYGDPSREGTAAWYPNPLLFEGSPRERVGALVRTGQLDKAVALYLETKAAANVDFAADDLERIAKWLEEHGMLAAAEGARNRI